MLFGCLALVIGYLVLTPLAFVVYTSFTPSRAAPLGVWTVDHYARIMTVTGGLSLLQTTLVFALGSSIVALAIGTALAWFAERTNTPFRNLAYLAAFISFAMPGVVKVIGWILLLGPRAGIVNVWAMGLFGLDGPLFNIFSLAGMVLVEGLLWAPVVFLLMVTPFRSMDASLEEAAAVSGAGIWRTFFKVTLPMALPSVLGVLLLTLIRAVESFEIPALLGIPAGVAVLTTELYLATKTGFVPEYGLASAYAVLMIVVMCGALYLYYQATRQSQRFATITGKGFRPRVIDLGPWRYVTGGLLLALPALVVLPLFPLFWASLLPYYSAPSVEALQSVSLANYADVFTRTAVTGAVTNSLVIGVCAATLTTVLTALAAWFMVRGRLRARLLLDQLASLPLVIPGIVMGMAVLLTYLRVPLLYGTIWVLVIAYTANFLPYGMRYGYSGVISIHRELEESARLSGASLRLVLWRIVGPLMMPALFATWIYTFLISVKLLSIAILLSGPRSPVISVAIWDLWVSGDITEVSAFSLVITLGVIVLALAIKRLSVRMGYQV